MSFSLYRLEMAAKFRLKPGDFAKDTREDIKKQVVKAGKDAYKEGSTALKRARSALGIVDVLAVPYAILKAITEHMEDQKKASESRTRLMSRLFTMCNNVVNNIDKYKPSKGEIENEIKAIDDNLNLLKKKKGLSDKEKEKLKELLDMSQQDIKNKDVEPDPDPFKKSKKIRTLTDQRKEKEENLKNLKEFDLLEKEIRKRNLELTFSKRTLRNYSDDINNCIKELKKVEKSKSGSEIYTVCTNEVQKFYKEARKFQGSYRKNTAETIDTLIDIHKIVADKHKSEIISDRNKGNIILIRKLNRMDMVKQAESQLVLTVSRAKKGAEKDRRFT